MGIWTPGPGATGGDDTFTGDGTSEVADGVAGSDTLNGNGGDDTLRGNTGFDTVAGGAGNDTLVLVAGDEVAGESYDGGANTDTLQVSGFVDTAMTFNSIEGITLVDNGAPGNGLLFRHNQLGAGFSTTLLITGSAGVVADAVTILAADDSNTVIDVSGFTFANWTPQSDRVNVWGAGGNDTLTGTTSNDNLDGGAGADVIHGGAGDDQLTGNTIVAADGATDQMHGGAGNDFYAVREASDIVIELADEGFSDGVYTQIAYTLPANVESLYLDPTALTGTGNGLGNSIYGSISNETMSGLGGNDQLSGDAGIDTLLGGDGNDFLDGGAGVDSMTGNAGDDTYVVDDASDTTTEGSPTGGIDLVQSSVTRTLTANLENLTLTGVAAITGYGNVLDNVINGNAAANSLYGFDGHDTLDGGAGADQMFGGNGDDLYVVDNAGDVTSEVSALGGSDRVFSSVTRNLTANIENLNLTGAADINGSGNSLNNNINGNGGVNTLYGFEGSDWLDGGGGADTLFGANGDDIYVVDNAGDITVEGSALGGIDTVQSSISRNLNANFENLTLTSFATHGYGNVLNNVMSGNNAVNFLYGFDGNDTLNGGQNADQMFGGNGDDIYLVDNAGDVTSEASPSGGTDTVFSSVDRNLTANLENLTLTGLNNITGAGNTLDNDVIGNAGVNTLFGLDGADTLDGRLGADTLQGGTGADEYVFSTALGGGNVDTINGYSVADDTIVLHQSIFTGLAVGTLAASAFVIGSAAADADDRIVYNSATGALSYDADGAGGAAAIQFATLTAGLALTNNDFIVSGP